MPEAASSKRTTNKQARSDKFLQMKAARIIWRSRKTQCSDSGQTAKPSATWNTDGFALSPQLMPVDSACSWHRQRVAEPAGEVTVMS
jgi:hypothetical protein